MSEQKSGGIPRAYDQTFLKGLNAAQAAAVWSRFKRVPFQNHQILSSVESPFDGLMLVSRGLITVVWPRARGTVTNMIDSGQLLGGYRPMQLSQNPDAPPLRLLATAHSDGELHVMSREDLLSLAADPAWTGDSYSRFASRIARNAALTAGPAWNMVRGSAGWAVSDAMEPMTVGATRPLRLFKSGCRDQRLYVVGFDSVVRITRRDASGAVVAVYNLEYGSAFGHADPGDRATTSAWRPELGDSTFADETAELISGDNVLRLSRVRLLVYTLPFSGVDPQGTLAGFVTNMAGVNLCADLAVDTLQRALRVRGLDVPRNDLYPVLQSAYLSSWRVGVAPPAGFGDLPVTTLLLDGELVGVRTVAEAAQRRVGETGERTVVMNLHRAPTLVELDEGIAELPHSDALVARVPSTVLVLPSSDVLSLLDADHERIAPRPERPDPTDVSRLRAAFVPDAMRALVSAADEAHVALPPSLKLSFAELILVMQLQGPEVATVDWRGPLRLLMESIDRDFQERSLLIHLVPEGAQTLPPRATDDAYEELWIAVPDDPRAVVRALAARADQLAGRRFSCVLIYPHADLRQMADLSRVTDRVLFLNEDPRAPMPTYALYYAASTYTSLMPADPRQGRDVVFPPGAVRLRLTASTLAGGERRLDQVTPAERVSLSRWARAATGRRVGVALGGGGIWGMSYIPVLRGLEEMGIPVDVISGASDGAHVAAWFATLGTAGLDILMKRRNLMVLNAVNVLSFATLTAFVSWLDGHLSGAYLEDLETVLIPVGTDVVTSSQVPILFGNVAQAVRMSASLTPLYPTTPTDRRVFLDGAYSANLPIEPLISEGVAMRIACNSVAPNPGLKARPPRVPGSLGLLLADLNLLRRGMNTWYGALTLGYNVGQRSSRDSTTRFESGWTDTLFVNVMSSPSVVRQMVAQPRTLALLLALSERWGGLIRPRVSRK